MDRPSPWVRPDPLPLPLETDRAVLDWYVEDDAPALFSAVSGSREALLPWLPWAREDHQDVAMSLDRIRTFAKERGYAHPESYPMAIFDRERRRVLGGTGFASVDEARAAADVGYWIRADRRRQGLCTEVVGRLISSAFTDWGFRRITIGCDGENRPSQRVAETLGLRCETREVRSRWLDEVGWSDHVGYAVLASEWDTERHRGPLCAP
jgi:ribosomal-protein-serine acetyltransferase